VHHDTEAPIDVNNNGVFFLNSRIGYDDVTDGSAYTLFMGEKIIEPGDLGWMSGTKATLRNTGAAINTTDISNGTFNWGHEAIGAPEAGGMYSMVPMDSGAMGAPESTEMPGGIGGPETSDPNAPSGEQGAEPTPTAQGPILPIGGFGSPHPGGAQFAFGDGRVSFLGETVDLKVYQQLGHRADGKLLDSGSY
jgi:prepilin-type processing-associated H-X9-DG protein